jgi:hypothetical protein
MLPISRLAVRSVAIRVGDSGVLISISSSLTAAGVRSEFNQSGQICVLVRGLPPQNMQGLSLSLERLLRRPFGILLTLSRSDVVRHRNDNFESREKALILLHCRYGRN